jgi:hypothetical protein
MIFPYFKLHKFNREALDLFAGPAGCRQVVLSGSRMNQGLGLGLGSAKKQQNAQHFARLASLTPQVSR